MMYKRHHQHHETTGGKRASALIFSFTLFFFSSLLYTTVDKTAFDVHEIKRDGFSSLFFSLSRTFGVDDAVVPSPTLLYRVVSFTM
jgi:hypothetical protein